MKRIEGGTASGQNWNRRLVSQLGFIKKKLRYPLSGPTLWPLIWIVGSQILSIAIIGTVLFANSSNRKRAYPFTVYMIIAVLIPGFAILVRYLRTLKFTSVPAQMTVAANMQLLERFFREHHFAYSRHPEAPEVFQMLSTSIRSLQNEREIVIFIADEKRMLINSHFTRTQFVPRVGAPRYTELAKMLDAWLKGQLSGNNQPGLRPI